LPEIASSGFFEPDFVEILRLTANEGRLTMLKKVLLVTAAAGLLSACADRWDADGARGMANSGSLFSKALQKEYADLAAAERAEFDWGDAAYFVHKAKAAASGVAVQPTALSERSLDAPYAAQAAFMRQTLMAALALPSAQKLPGVAAKAQAAGFDCYMQEAEEGHQPDDIAACKATFDAAIKTLTAVVAPTGPYIIYFKTGSSQLDSNAMAVVKGAVDAYKANKDVTVMITGHTDTVGNARFNLLLSQKRAESVSAALSSMGVPDSVKALTAYGEDKLRVGTVDGVAEAQNRRVEIMMKP
jgi:outer membrane protein OmpA-like peptidoglycan-associated protein